MNRTNSHGLSLFQKDQLMDIENTVGHTTKRFPTKSELLNNGVGSQPSDESLAYHLDQLKAMENKVAKAALDKQYRDALAGKREPKSDLMQHPEHYKQYEGFNVLDVCQQLTAPDGSGNFNRGNVFKYLARAGWKSEVSHKDDLKLAMFYLQREIDRVGRSIVPMTPPSPVLCPCPVCQSPIEVPGPCPEMHGWLRVSETGDAEWLQYPGEFLNAQKGEDNV